MAQASEPLDHDMQAAIAPPLLPFTTMARDRRLLFKFFNSGPFDRGHLTIGQRGIAIDRVTACCGAEYEWAVHVSAYAGKAELTDSQVVSLVMGGPDHDCCTAEDRVLIGLPLEPGARRFPA